MFIATPLGVAKNTTSQSFKFSTRGNLNIPGILSIEKLLFSETGGFIIEVEDSKIENVIEVFNNHNINLDLIGETSKDQRLVINDAINMEVEEIKSLWTDGLREKIK